LLSFSLAVKLEPELYQNTLDPRALSFIYWSTIFPFFKLRDFWLEYLVKGVLAIKEFGEIVTEQTVVKLF
jgi:hypothetical protein